MWVWVDTVRLRENQRLMKKSTLWELTYPSYGKGNSSSQVPFWNICLLPGDAVRIIDFKGCLVNNYIDAYIHKTTRLEIIVSKSIHASDQAI